MEVFCGVFYGIGKQTTMSLGLFYSTSFSDVDAPRVISYDEQCLQLQASLSGWEYLDSRLQEFFIRRHWLREMRLRDNIHGALTFFKEASKS